MGDVKIFGVESANIKVYYLPNLKKNLLSVSQLVKDGFRVVVDENGAEILKGNKVCFTASLYNGVYILDIPEYVLSIHERLGHVNFKYLKRMGLSKNEKPYVCKGCVEGEHAKKPFKNKTVRQSKAVLEFIHTDLCGPLPVESYGGSKYFMTIIDDFSRFSRVYFLQKKSEAAGKIQQYIVEVENLHGCKVKEIKSDCGGEFSSNDLSTFLHSKGIKHNFTSPYSHQQNGVAERMNRTLLKKARSMIFMKDQSIRLWSEAVETANYLRNITYCSTIEKTPFEVWFDKKPKYDHLKIWGSLVWVKCPNANKLEKQSEAHLFVGYGEDRYGYKVLNPYTGVFSYVREVIFDEKNTLKIEFENVDANEEEDDDFEEEIDDEEDTVTLDLSKKSLYRQFQDIIAGKEVRPRNADIPIRYRKEINNVSDVYIPETVKDVLSCPEKEKWIAAMDEEMQAMKQNEVWVVVDKPKSCKLVSTKWVFTIKKDSAGVVQRYKARLVARGFSQIPGVNVNETFSPVIRTESIRLLLMIALRRKVNVRQFDIKTAFLNGSLEEEVYIKQPEGYSDGTKRVCRLNKALYGLKQSPRMWNQCLVTFLKEQGFAQLKSDQCVLTRGHTIVGIHVDDFILLYSSNEDLKEFVETISKRFDVKDLGDLNYFLNVKIERKDDKFILSQHRFIEETIEQFNIKDAKPLYTPIDPSIKLSTTQCPTTEQEIQKMKAYPYRELIGKLNYLSLNTRPDIAVSVSKLSRFMNNPGLIHWKMAIKVLRYVKTTKDFCLVLQPTDDRLCVYTDADWAGEIDDRRSTSGHCILFGGSLVSWKTKLQSAISLSTMESEFYALTYALQEVKAVNHVLEEINIKQEQPIVIYEDNQSTIKFSNNSAFKGRAKHIDLRYNYVKECIEQEWCILNYCETKNMLADIFTKAVDRRKIEICCKALGCYSPQMEC